MRGWTHDTLWSGQSTASTGFLEADSPDESPGESSGESPRDATVGHGSATRTDPALRDRVARLELQVMQQYTAMAAYSTIGQQQVATAQAELRADIDRAKALAVGLIDRTRREILDQLTSLQLTTGGRTGGQFDPSDSGAGTGEASRLDLLEQRFEALANALERSVQNQMALAEQLAGLVEDSMRRDGWLMADGSAGALSLR